MNLFQLLSQRFNRTGRMRILQIITLLIFTLLMISATFAAMAADVQQPNFQSQLTGLPVTFTNTTQSVTSAPVVLRQSTGQAFVASLVAAQATNTMSVTLNFEVTADGTNYTTIKQFQWPITLTGNTNTIVATNWAAMGSPPTLGNFRAIKFVSATTASGTGVTINWIEQSHGNQ